MSQADYNRVSAVEMRVKHLEDQLATVAAQLLDLRNGHPGRPATRGWPKGKPRKPVMSPAAPPNDG